MPWLVAHCINNVPISLRTFMQACADDIIPPVVSSSLGRHLKPDVANQKYQKWPSDARLKSVHLSQTNGVHAVLQVIWKKVTFERSPITLR